MSTNKNIGTEGINDLLKQAFLNTDFNDPKNEKLLFAASQSALGGGRPFQPSSKNFVQKLSGTSKLVITLTTVALVSSGSWYYLKNKNAEPVQNTTIVPVIATHDSTGREETPDSKDAIIQEQKIPDKIKVAHTGNQVQRINDSTITKSPTVVYSKPLTSISYKAPVDPKIDTSYVFPKLTDKEIKDNEKQKIWMFDMVAKQNKSRYPLIPSGNYTYNGMQIPVQSFYMGCGMVTNFEYRTFLSDLLIHNRKSDFLIAKPDQKLWKQHTELPYGQYMTENYFSDTRFNDYPVVGISRQAAEMYCRWITDGTNAWLEHKNKTIKVTVQLPSDVEWDYAASSCNKDSVYPWGTASINSTYKPSGKDKGKNKDGCFLANFCLKKYTGSTDSMRECTKTPYKNAYTTAGYIIGENIYTCPVYSYNPNSLGLYCMSGNAAEMVNVQSAQGYTPGTKGGSWNSDVDHIMLHATDEYAGETNPSPYIGFRLVVVVNK